MCEKRKFNYNKILATSQERRERLISVLVETRNREGITITREQAREEYDQIQQSKGDQC